MEYEILNEKYQILMKNNDLIKTKYNLSTLANRMFIYILFQLQKKQDNTMQCEILIDDIKKSIIKSKKQKVNKNITLETIKEVLLALSNEIIEYIDHEGEGYSHFIYNFKFIENYTKVRIYADREIYALIKSYVGYTPVDINIFLSLRSPYSQRFYDWIRLWSGIKKEIIYNVDALKEMLKLKDAYKEYGQFKLRVLNPAIKELTEKANMKINLQEIKSGKKITHIKFIVNDKEPRKYFQDKKDSTYTKNTLENKYKQKNYNKQKELKFKNFDEREYDYKSLERQLLGWGDE